MGSPGHKLLSPMPGATITVPGHKPPLGLCPEAMLYTQQPLQSTTTSEDSPVHTLIVFGSYHTKTIEDPTMWPRRPTAVSQSSDDHVCTTEAWYLASKKHHHTRQNHSSVQRPPPPSPPLVLELSSVSNQMLPLDNGEAASAIVASPNLYHLSSSRHVGTAYFLNQHHQLFSPHQRGSTDIPTATSSGAAYTSGMEFHHRCRPEIWGLLLLLLLMSEGNTTTTASFDSTSLTPKFSSSMCVILATAVAATGAAVSAPDEAAPSLQRQRTEATTPRRTDVSTTHDVTVAASAAEIIVVVSLLLKHSPSSRDIAVAAVITKIIVVVSLSLKHPLSSRNTTAIIV